MSLAGFFKGCVVAVGLLLDCWAPAALGQASASLPVVARQVSPSAWFVQGESALGTPRNRNFVHAVFCEGDPDRVPNPIVQE